MPTPGNELLGPVNTDVIVVPAPRQKTVEELVREYFKNTPELISVAWCESRFTQFDADGSIHRGRVNSDDIGVMQINIVYHLQRALDLGIDIFSTEGNMAYAKYLYDQQGLAPWRASEPCWSRYVSIGNPHVAYAEAN